MRKKVSLLISIVFIFGLASCGNGIISTNRSFLEQDNEVVNTYEEFTALVASINEQVEEIFKTSAYIEDYETYSAQLEEMESLNISDIKDETHSEELLYPAKMKVSEIFTFLQFINEDDFVEGEEYAPYDNQKATLYANDDYIYYSVENDINDEYSYFVRQYRLRILDEDNIIFESYTGTGLDKESEAYTIIDTRVGMTHLQVSTREGSRGITKESIDFKKGTYERLYFANYIGEDTLFRYEKDNVEEGYSLYYSKNIRYETLAERYMTYTSQGISIYKNELVEGTLYNRPGSDNLYEFLYGINAFTNIDNVRDGGLYNGDDLVYELLYDLGDNTPVDKPLSQIINSNITIKYIYDELDDFDPNDDIGNLETDINFEDYTSLIEDINKMLEKNNIEQGLIIFEGNEYSLDNLQPVLDDLLKDIPKEYQ